MQTTDFLQAYQMWISNAFKRQRIRTIAAQIVLGRSTMDSATQCLKELHWLPIQLRIHYKILVTVYKCLSNQVPTYLQSMLQRQTITRTTRPSQDQTLVAVPRTTKKIFADRSFSVVGPTLWNQLPKELRILESLDAKSKLKTFLFDKYYV